jgi:outer membrane protein assembly factor BamD (BamD/ComL family)
MIKSIKKSAFLFVPLIVILFSACTTTANISEDLSPAELIQRAQEASDRKRYSVAMQFYEALHERFRHNIDLVITAEYEIAFIHYKQRNFQQAREGFYAMLEYYNTPDEALLPQHFKRLAHIVLERIDERENRRRR